MSKYAKTNNIVFAACAFTGIAATLMIEGQTLHSKFKLPVPIDTESVSGIKPDSPEGRALYETKIILIDEASMSSKYIQIFIRKFYTIFSN